MHRSPLRIIVLAVAVAMLAFASASRSVTSATSATIAVDMDPATPGAQDAVTLPRSTSAISVDIMVENASAIGAFDIEVTYDSQLLALTSWTEGPFLGSTGRTTACAPIISTQSLRVGCGTFGPTPPQGASGDGVLIHLSFRDLQVSTTCLTLTVATTAGTDGEPLATVPQDGCLTVSDDSDGDGVADLVDNCPLVANAGQQNTDAGNVAAGRPGTDALGDACDNDIDGDGYTNGAETAIGRSPYAYCRIMRADVDGDGVVSILDIATIAQYFLRMVTPSIERVSQDADSSISILDLANASVSFLKRVNSCP